MKLTFSLTKFLLFDLLCICSFPADFLPRKTLLLLYGGEVLKANIKHVKYIVAISFLRQTNSEIRFLFSPWKCGSFHKKKKKQKKPHQPSDMSLRLAHLFHLWFFFTSANIPGDRRRYYTLLHFHISCPFFFLVDISPLRYLR